MYFSYDILTIGNSRKNASVRNVDDIYKQTYNRWDGYIQINFTSDTSVTRKGFSIEYNAGIEIYLHMNLSQGYHDVT